MQTYTRKNENDTSNQVIRKWQRAESQQANPITKSKPFAKLITTTQTKQTEPTQKTKHAHIQRMSQQSRYNQIANKNAEIYTPRILDPECS